MPDLDWLDFVAAATSCGWTTNVATADRSGAPHVAIVAPGFEEGVIWFATRSQSKKARNLRENQTIALHWPVGNPDAHGEVYARGTATVLDSPADRQGLWNAGVMPYDLAQFFGSPDDEGHLFVRVDVESATLIGPDSAKRSWTRG